MKLTIAGLFAGERRLLVWEDGEFGGDPVVEEAVRAELALQAGEPVDLPGAGDLGVVAADNPYAIIHVAKQVFDDDPHVRSNDLPDIPEEDEDSKDKEAVY